MTATHQTRRRAIIGRLRRAAAAAIGATGAVLVATVPLAHAATPPVWPDWAAALTADVAVLARVRPDSAWSTRPTIRAADLGIPADGRRDATRALQAALDSLTRGGTLLLGPGVYRQSDCIKVRRADVRIVGRDARIHAVNPARMCIDLAADRVEIRGLVLTADTKRRGTAIEGARIVLRAADARVIDNRITGSTAAGIWVEGASDYAIIGNTVTKTLADGIYQAGGARNGYVARNTTDATGDDGISVVSYRKQPICSRILIEDNRVSDLGTARGLSVVGGDDVVMRRNVVTGTVRAAGIIVTREQSYDTHGVERVILADNTVSGVAKLPDRAGNGRTGQASIDINAFAAPEPDMRVRRVLVARNVVSNGATDGVRLLGSACDVDLIGNRIVGMEGTAIKIVDPACGVPIAACDDNSVDDPGALPPPCRPDANRKVDR